MLPLNILPDSQAKPDLLIHYPQHQRGGNPLVDHQRDAQALRNFERNGGIDLVDAYLAGNQAGIGDVQRNPPECNRRVDDGRGASV